MKKTLLVFGTRPEALKMAPVVKELRDTTERPEAIEADVARLVGTDRVLLKLQLQNC